MTTDPTNQDATTALALAETLEAKIATQLLRAAHMLIETQTCTQPADVETVRVALAEAAEWEVQVTFGALPRIRVVTVNHDGDELQLIRRIDLAPLTLSPPAH